MHDVLAGIECGPVDESLVTPFEHLSVAVQFADVEPVAENVRKRRAAEAGLAVAEDVSFADKLVGETLERMVPGYFCKSGYFHHLGRETFF